MMLEGMPQLLRICLMEKCASLSSSKFLSKARFLNGAIPDQACPPAVPDFSPYNPLAGSILHEKRARTWLGSVQHLQENGRACHLPSLSWPVLSTEATSRTADRQ